MTARRGLFVSSQTRACESLSISLFSRYSSPKRLQRGTSSSGFEDSACIKRLLARLVCNVSLGYLPRRRSGLSLSFRPEFFVHTWALFRPHAWLFSLTCYISPNPFFTNKHYRVTSSTLMTTPLRKTSRRQRRQKDDFWGLHHPRRPHVQASSNPHGPSIRYHEYQP